MRIINFLTLCVMLLLAACSQADIEQDFLAPASGEDVLYVSSEEGETRVMLSEAKSVWQKDDCMSVFYGTPTNQKWQYVGETGSRKGELRPTDNGTTKGEGHIVALYPYNESNTLNTDNYSVGSTLPATQNYVADSYDPASNLMVAHSDNNTLVMKNLCGWLRLSLTGNGEKVKSIVIKGNNGEKVAGVVTANSSTAALEILTSNNTYDEVKMACGEGVTLSSDATDFYITLPPRQYSKGLTATIECTDGKIMTKTTNTTTIVRNTIQPMAAIAFAEDAVDEEEIIYPANNQIWYRTYSGDAITTITNETFGATIKESSFGVCIGENCYPFHYITFENDITSIPAKALLKNEDLETIYLPHSVKSIGDSAMYGCTMLSEIHLGKGLESIGTGAFTNSPQIKEIYCHAQTPPTLGEYVFKADGGTGHPTYVQAMIYVSASSLDTYKARWSQFAEYIRGYDFINGEEITTGGNEGGEATKSNFKHRILLIDHTGCQCPYCPEVIDRLYALANYPNPIFDFSDYYNEVQCHGGKYADNDPAFSYAAQTVDSYYRNTARIINGYPTLSINFRDGSVSRGSNNEDFVEKNMNIAFKKYRNPLGADAGIKVSNRISGSNINIDIEVTSAKRQEYRVAAWVLENDIYSPNQKGAVTELHKRYNHTLRYVAGAYSSEDISGDALGMIDVGNTASKSYSVPLSSSWVSGNLEILVIVSAPDNTGVYEIVNTTVCPINSAKDYDYL